MVMHKNVPYIRCRDGIYYFVRRVPVDEKSYCSSDRITKTKIIKEHSVLFANDTTYIWCNES